MRDFLKMVAGSVLIFKPELLPQVPESIIQFTGIALTVWFMLRFIGGPNDGRRD